MGKDSKIQWTHNTFNPWRGCTKVSPGCKFCYAERGAHRNPKVLGEWGPDGTRVLASESKWAEPLAWNRAAESAGRPELVFCASLADVFEDWPGQMTDSQKRPLYHTAVESPTPLAGLQWPGAPPYNLDNARRRLWDLIRITPWLRWQLLTKRPENIARMMPHGEWPNVWLGTSVESQDYTPRIDELLTAPQVVPVRFISAEPLLGPLSLWDQLHSAYGGVNWVIVGGESGGEARPFHIPWAQSIIAQCKDAGVPCFLKQLGKVAMLGRGMPLKLVSDPGHGGDPDDWPEGLEVREIPSL